MTINRTNRSIGIVGRPCPRAVTSHARSTGSKTAGSLSNTSSAARAAGSSRTSSGNTSSNNDST